VIRRQLAAMPNEDYLVRLIHHQTGSPCAGERIWSAGLLSAAPAVAFLRARNREGFHVFFHPYGHPLNSGYILLDLDHPAPHVIPTMRAHGHEPCVVLQTSPGHLQAWVRVSVTPLEPVVATAIGRELAQRYGGDPASADWRHLGRLAGFTNPKIQHRRCDGFAPFVKLLYAHCSMATGSASLLESARQSRDLLAPLAPFAGCDSPQDSSITPAAALHIYQACLRRLRIPQRFPQTDWSIADKWIAKDLFRRGTPLADVRAILKLGSPLFPRRHGDPDDYLRRTLARAARELQAWPFSAGCPRTVALSTRTHHNFSSPPAPTV
jgi:RepB DNA-primase from phage plasmid